MERFKQRIPARQRSAFVKGLLEQALPENDDTLHRIALDVEQKTALNAEIREWRETLVADLESALLVQTEPNAKRCRCARIRPGSTAGKCGGFC